MAVLKRLASTVSYLLIIICMFHQLNETETSLFPSTMCWLHLLYTLFVSNVLNFSLCLYKISCFKFRRKRANSFQQIRYTYTYWKSNFAEVPLFWWRERNVKKNERNDFRIKLKLYLEIILTLIKMPKQKRKPTWRLVYGIMLLFTLSIGLTRFTLQEQREISSYLVSNHAHTPGPDRALRCKFLKE